MIAGVAEPMTVASDYLVAGACAYFSLSLAATHAPIEWPLGFALGGISAALGGTWHGFRQLLRDRTRNVLWMLTLLTFGASAAAFGAGTANVVALEQQRLAVQLAAVTAAGIFGVAALHNPDFGTAGRMALLMLATFALMAGALMLRGAMRPALLVIGCVALNGAGVGLQMRRIAPHPRFNHNDLFHVFQLAALWCLYGAVRGGVI